MRQRWTLAWHLFLGLYIAAWTSSTCATTTRHLETRVFKCPAPPLSAHGRPPLPLLHSKRLARYNGKKPVRDLASTPRPLCGHAFDSRPRGPDRQSTPHHAPPRSQAVHSSRRLPVWLGLRTQPGLRNRQVGARHRYLSLERGHRWKGAANLHRRAPHTCGRLSSLPTALCASLLSLPPGRCPALHAAVCLCLLGQNRAERKAAARLRHYLASVAAALTDRPQNECQATCAPPSGRRSGSNEHMAALANAPWQSPARSPRTAHTPLASNGRAQSSPRR